MEGNLLTYGHAMAFHYSAFRKEAINGEMQSITENNTWVSYKPISCK